jgi:hypothetical protein
MTTDLDSRLHRAAGSLRHSVADLPADQPPRPGPQRRAALGLGVLLVTGVLAATIAARSNDTATELDVAPAAEVQALIADPVPEGLQVGWVGEQTAQAAAGVDTGAGAAAAGGTASAGPVDLYTYIYGDAGADAPFGTSDLVINVWDSTAGAEAHVNSYGEAQISAADATVGVRGLQGLLGVVDGVTSLRWYEAPDVEVVLASRTLSSDDLLAIAEGLAMDGTNVALGTLPAALPGPLDQVGQLGGATVAGARATVASWVGYTGVAASDVLVDVTTLVGGTDELMALVWELGATQQVGLRGGQAFMAAGAGVGAATDVAGDTIDLVWQEASGVLVHVTALGMGQNDLLAIVDGLRSSTEAEWANVTELAATAQAAAAAAVDTATDAVGEAESEAEATTDAGLDATGSTVDDGIDAVTDVVTDLGTTLHEDLGAEAVVGALGSIVSDVEEGVGGITGSAGAGANAEAEADGGLLP